MNLSLLGVIVHTLLVSGFMIRALSRPHRDPTSRVAWIAVIAALPAIGIMAYILLGETNIGRRRVQRMKRVLANLPPMPEVRESDRDNAVAQIPSQYAHLFQTGRSINGFPAIGGNSGRLMADSNTAIENMVADIDAATSHVHLIFYIWLADNNGTRMIEALQRAANRGVKCRAMADALGSRGLIRSPHWKSMQQAGVDVAVALPIGNPLLKPLGGRLDLRNHRKILVIDDRITYCGSQNCADPEFRVKARYAPWVDAVIRFEGPIVRQNQFLFASDWMSYADECLDDLLKAPIAAPHPGFPAQVIGTGPTFRFSAMPEVFESLFHAAREELVITTPYFVPDEAMLSALCAAAWRGVETKIIFPARNDSWIVAGASRSYYPALLQAGIQIYQYEGGLLHTKSVTVDGQITLIGSANMDRRSFDLNYENNILFYDPELTRQVRERQAEYMARSHLVSLEEIQNWSLGRQLWHNGLATLGPVL